jgi:hypothetical protein
MKNQTINENGNWPIQTLNGQLLINALLTLGAGLYTVLFWQAELGLNALLFGGFLSGVVWLLHPEYRIAPRLWLLTLGVLLSALAVVWQHSLLAQVTHIASIFLLLGFAQARELRFLGFALLLAVSGLLSAPITWWRRWEYEYEAAFRWVRTWSYLILLPFGLLLLFFSIYYAANAQFAQLVNLAVAWLPGFSPWKSIALLLQGFMVMTVLIWPSVWTSDLFNQEKTYSMWKLRRRTRNQGIVPTLALRRHYYSALLSFALLNGLLLIVNLTDIQGVWLSQQGHSAAELSDYVHQGTYLLIAALGLAMAVIAYFFSGNLHFLQNNQPLKALAYAWIAQNTILAISVAGRNFHYIAEYGLAYKRLGVLWFLILVVLGLYSLFVLIRERRSLFYLWVVNAWFVYCSLLLTSFANWDVLITQYNLHGAHHAKIDARFLLKEVSDKNLPLLINEHDLLLERSNIDAAKVDRLLHFKIERFEKRKSKQGWRGWNWADQKTQKVL